MLVSGNWDNWEPDRIKELQSNTNYTSAFENSGRFEVANIIRLTGLQAILLNVEVNDGHAWPELASIVYMNHLVISKTYGWQHHELKTLNHNFLLKKEKNKGWSFKKKAGSLEFSE